MDVELPSDEELERLRLSPEVAWYLLSRGYELPVTPPKIKTPEPRLVPGAVFDPVRVDRVVDAFARLRHTQGKWRGRPITLRAWQVGYLIGPTYGWVRPDVDGVLRRIIQRQYLDIPRKNAKTTIGGGQCIYLTCADGEPGAQVYALATRKDQARFCFDPIRELALHAPDLAPNVKALRDRITHPRSGSFFGVMSAAGDAMHGASPHGGFIDELHLHKTRELIEAVETGTGARSQPLVMYATTADAGTPNSPYAQIREYAEQLARGVFEDPAFYGVVFGADDDDDPFAEATWLKANPGAAAGDSPSLDFLRKQADAARNSPVELASFKRLHLGIRTRQQTKYLELDVWDRNRGLLVEENLRGRQAYGGLDLASTSDLCALAWVFPSAPGEGFDAVWRLWTPEANLPALDKRTAGQATVWAREGLLTVTPGNVADYDFIREQIARDMEKFEVRGVAYDPWNASQLVNDLVSMGAPMVKTRQGLVTLSAPTKELQRVLLEGTVERPMFRHGGNPAVRWQVDNLAVAMDPAGNVKPDKGHSADKIDAVAAAINAMSLILAMEPKKVSKYEREGLTAV